MMQRLFISTTCLLLCFASHAQNAGNGNSTLLAEVEQLQAKYEKDVNAAFVIADAVQKAGAYVESLAALFENGEITLPVGIKSKDAGYALIIEKITHDEKTGKAIVHALCAFEFKDSGQRIAFTGEAVVEGRNGIGTEGLLSLMAPVRRNMGKEAAVVIREGTSVKFGCEGIELFDAKMTFVVTSNTIIPIDNSGKPANGPVAFDFDATFRDFENYTLSLSINRAFSIKGLKDVIFTLKGAALDQSDTETSSMTRFPEKYFASGSEDEIRLWKGLAITEASVSLPAIIKKPGSDGERVTIALQQVLFDENGFTGNVSVKDLLNSAAIDPSQWSVSVNDFALDVLKNEIVSFGFGGDLSIPPFGSHSLIPYMATFNPAMEEYEIKAGIAGKYEFPVLGSTLELNDLSTIEVLIRDSDIYPSIHASGILNINAPIGSDSSKKFTLPGITFENMVISRESPYFKLGAIGITGNLQAPKIGGFELSINDIHTVDNQKGSGLAFEAEVTLSDMFSGKAGLQLYGDYQHWKFKELYVDKVNVEFESSAFSLSGGVWFKNGDAVYGDGFRGDINLTLLNTFDFKAVGVFGKKDDYRYFLTDAFFELAPSAGIYIPPALSFYGFGGGLYMRMQQMSRMPQPVANVDPEFGKSLSNITYVPDKKVGLGVMATTKFALQAASSAINANVGFEMQFNSHGGLNFAQLRGDLSVMSPPDKWGKLMDNITDRMNKLEASGTVQPVKAKKADIEKSPSHVNSGFFTANVNIEYDMMHSVFSADLNTYLNAGIITGRGEGGRMGWASAYFSPDKWYARVGTPSDKVGVKVLGLADLGGYFMVGNDIPGLPLPPEKVLKNLSRDKQEKLQRTSSDKLMFGKGIAFGAGLEVDFNATLPPFYAHIGAGVGSEFLLVDIGGRTCANYAGKPGINGWYASVQAWAYVEADIGIGVRIFGRSRNFSILDISVGALLQGSGPNPMYFAGAVGGRFRVLGGLISGNCSFDFEIGEQCILSAGSPFGEDVIAELTPVTGEKDISVFVAPQAIFNVPVEVEMEIEEENVKGIYKATLEKFELKYKETGKEITAKSKFSSDKSVCMIDPAEPFESQKDVEVYAKVGFKKKINNNWVYVLGDDGSPLYEEKKEEFRTGDRPEEILPEHVKYSYPVNRQYNFYPDEYKNGYIMIAQNYTYLFTTEKPEGFNQILRISDINGKKYEKPFAHYLRNADNGIKFEIGFSMEQIPFEKNQIYTLAIVNVPQQANADVTSNITTVTTTVEGAEEVEVNRKKADGALLQLDEKEIYAMHFRSSEYNTFLEKIDAIPVDEAVAWQEYPYVYNIISNIYDYARPAEMFDVAEIDPLDPAQRLVVIEPAYEKTDWYIEKVKPLIYDNRLLQDAGLPDMKLTKEEVSYYSTRTPSKELEEEMIETNARHVISPWGSLHYRAPYYVDRDYCAIKNALANKRARGAQLGEAAAALFRTDHIPLIENGKYPVKISYVLQGPGQRVVTSAEEKTVSLTRF
ncbi:MAG: hypothetical protein LBD52_02790 [Prevotellaceae bacterium]|jgi:hypothetical protein|nr:hypothetical protein [Prevotellaceae bacterium]